MNEKSKGFLEIISAWQGEVIIYGAGVWGNRIFDLLVFEKITVKYFAVSQKSCGVGYKRDVKKGIAIKEISELSEYRNSAMIILAGNPDTRIQMEKTARNLGFVNILSVDKETYIAEMLAGSEEKVCPVCEKAVKFFNSFGLPPRNNAQCPICDSLERHRALWLFLQKENMLEGKKKVLHFAPEKCLLERISEYEDIDYYPVDIDENMYGIKEVVDITDIPYKSGAFDIIICSHVLEHIENENKALSELARVLSDTGTAIINVPVYDLKTTFEKPEYNTPELRRKYYGQDDHVRMYGHDITDRLGQKFIVEQVRCNEDLSEAMLAHYGLWENETIYLCKK